MRTPLFHRETAHLDEQEKLLPVSDIGLLQQSRPLKLNGEDFGRAASLYVPINFRFADTNLSFLTELLLTEEA
ncbi:hypothetical protein ABE66_06545 [Cytobacillus firmus]|nr:hypothetical protein [Cytobacillus firmus]